jgi:hypothetical protein
MSKTFNKDIQYIFNPQITLPTSSGLTITGNSNTIGNIFTTGGNVGIGTTSPSLPFSVVGSMNNNNLVYFKNSNTNGTTAIQLENANGNSAFIGISSTSNSLTLFRNRLFLQSPTDTVFTVNGINTNGVLFIQTSGNVGIGTTAPAHKLDVNGTIDATTYTGSNIMVSGSIGSLGSIDAGSQFLGQPNDGATSPSFSWTGDTNTGMYRPLTDTLGFVTNGTEIMRLSSAGNVGIGTTAPSAKLDVFGTIEGITSLNTNFSAPNTLQNTASINNPSVLALLAPNMPTSGTTNFFTGRALSNYNACDVQYAYVGTGSTQNSMRLGFYGQPTYNMSLLGNGNVGIGTTGPVYTLDVRGSLRSTGDIFIGDGTNAEAITLWDIPGAAWQLSTGDYKLSIQNGTGGSTMNTRVTITSIGNVGIGTNAPGAKLSVDFNGITQNQNVLGLHTSNTGTTDYNLIEAGHGASTSFVLKGSGNVGIGTTAPAYKLHIVDNTSSPFPLWLDGSSKAVNNGIQINSNTGGGYVSFINFNNNNIVSSNTLLQINTTSTLTTALQPNGGNVGIGTTSPSAPLHVKATSNISPANNGIYCYNPTNSANQHAVVSVRTGGAASGNPYVSWDIDGVSGWSMGIDNSDGDKLKISGGWDTLSLTKMTFSGNNVGIMTTGPAYTLDVNGTIARSGVRLPRFDNGSFSGSSSFSIPILFNDTNYNYCEIKVRYVVGTTNITMNLSATSYASVAMAFSECALTTVKWNAQSTPDYQTFTSTTSGVFAVSVESAGIDNNIIFRIVRSSGGTTAGLRNHYSYDHTYCWAGVGTARGYGQGHIDNASVGGSPLQFITFTCSSGTVSGTYSTVHSY